MASLQDVALATGLSTATVSLVMSNKSSQVGISKSTKERVRKMANELGYRPNLMARGLSTGQTYTIGLLFSSPRELIYSELLAEIQTLLRPYRYGGMCAFWEDEVSAAEAFSSVYQRGVDAIITSHNDMTLIPATMPTTLLFLQDELHDSVIYDRAIAMELIVQHLLELGHHKLGLVGLRPDIYEELLLAALGPRLPDVDLSWVYHPQPNYLEEGRICLAKIFGLAAAQRPTALICRNDTMAMLAISEAGKIGLRVPHDISVIGRDAVFLGSLTNPPLSSVGVSPSELATQVVEVTLNRLRNPDAPRQNIVLTPKLYERASCAPPAW